LPAPAAFGFQLMVSGQLARAFLHRADTFRGAPLTSSLFMFSPF
jgi:hypothetical protein